MPDSLSTVARVASSLQMASSLPIAELREHVPDDAALRSLLFPPQGETHATRNPSAVQLLWGQLVTASKTAQGSSETVRGGWCARARSRTAARPPSPRQRNPITRWHVCASCVWLLPAACARWASSPRTSP